MNENHPNCEVAIFAGGCFWCTEALFNSIKGIEKVYPGYIGGENENPTYEQVCVGDTGHAEAIKIYFDSSEISYIELLEIFFDTHDPTTLNQQGGDIGTQYRSEIFFTNESQKKIAQEYLDILSNEKVYNSPIVTKISLATAFFIAEDYHKNYYTLNKESSYCNLVISPKMAKFRKNYISKLK